MRYCFILSILSVLFFNNLYSYTDEQLEKIGRMFRDDSCENKQKMAIDVFLHPKKYNPDIWYAAGLELLRQKDFEKAAVLCVGAIYGTCIHGRLIADRAVPQAVWAIAISINLTIEDLNLTDAEYQQWVRQKSLALENFKVWNHQIPLNQSLKSPLTQDQKNRVIVRTYKEIEEKLKGHPYYPEPEDAVLADMADTYFFHPKTRVFHINSDDLKLSCVIPKELNVNINDIGKYDGVFNIEGGHLYFSNFKLMTPADFEKESNLDYLAEAVEEKNYKCSKEEGMQFTIKKALIGYHRHYWCQFNDDPIEVKHTYALFIDGKYRCYFQLDCNRETEDRCLQLVHSLITSIKSSSTD